MNRIHSWYHPFFIFIFATTLHGQVRVKNIPISTDIQEIIVSFDFDLGDYLYKDFLHISVDQPTITLSPWKASISSISYFDPTFNAQKEMYNKPFEISLQAQNTAAKENSGYLRITYYQKSQKKIKEMVYPLSFKPITHKTESKESPSIPPSAPLASEPKEEISSSTWSARIQSILEHTQSMSVRIIFALLLGLLLSLTPCIYPMIPITVGILQAHASSSPLHNFALASSYTAGIATTFALLGTFAAFTGHIFGSFMTHPLTIFLIICVLLYLAFSMLGCYEMYVPSLFKSSGNEARGGSLLAAFTFGALSGTVASPCLSPGLLLLLTLVTTIGSMLIGFILLFAFGIGLSIPLLIIGTFSTSLHTLPRAGAWMVEIKKIFGLMMIAMCFHFINPLVSPFMFMVGITCFAISAGSYMLWQSKNAYAFKRFYSVAGVIILAMVPLLIIKSYQLYTMQFRTAKIDDNALKWLSDYEQARTIAQQEGKFILVDVSGPFCSICKAIDKKIIAHKKVQKRLKKYTLLKIEDTQSCQQHQNLCQQFKIVGVPTFIVIDPHTQKEICRWGSELYDEKPESFAQNLKIQCRV